ncbi:MAG: pyridoxal 5'-phosphate synthase glutaminase subunit PdxT [Micrococcales bacterium]
MTKPIGVLALQGDFREHGATLDRLGVRNIKVRTLEELESVSGLIIPGGESTVMHKLAVAYGLLAPIREAIAGGLPVFGTCAGLIMLADRITDGIVGQETFGGLDVTVRRNAFGHQVDSFEVDLAFQGVQGPVHAAFIRAPLITEVGVGAEVVAEIPADDIHPDGGVVGVRQGNLLGISFHPEVTGEDRVHALFADMVASAR